MRDGNVGLQIDVVSSDVRPVSRNGSCRRCISSKVILVTVLIYYGGPGVKVGTLVCSCLLSRRR